MMHIRRRKIGLTIAALLIALISLVMAGAVLLRSFRAGGGLPVLLFEQMITQVLALMAVASSLRQLGSGHQEWPLSILFEGLYGLLASIFFYGVADGLAGGSALPTAERATALVALVLLPLPQIVISHERLKAPAPLTVLCLLLTAVLPVVGLAVLQVTGGLMRGACVAMVAVFVVQLALMAVRLPRLSFDAHTLSLAVCAGGFVAGVAEPVLRNSFTMPNGVTRHMLLAAMLLTAGSILHLWRLQRQRIYSRLSDLSRREEEYRLAAEQSGKLVMRFDVEARRLTLNPDAAEFLGLPAVVEGVPDSLIENGFIAPNSRVAYRRFHERIFLGESEGSGIFSVRGGGGETVRMRADFTRIVNGPRVHCVISCCELGDLGMEAYRKRRTADELTGLLTRSAFVSRVEALSGEARPSLSYAILAVDIDGFKNINDAFGHQFGNRALCEAAGELRAILRKDDFAARFGSDEFVICLRDLPCDDAFLEGRCHALCRLIGKQYGDGTSMTVSVGVAVFPTDGDSFDRLYHYACQGLASAKRAGGNRFARGGDEVPRCATESVAQLPPSHTGDAPHPSTIVVVHSREDIRREFREAFEGEYSVRLLSTTDEARELLETSAHTLCAMLLEAGMEDGGGLGLLREMSEDAYYQSIPVIMLNVEENAESTREALELGAADFIHMPVDTRLACLRVRNAIMRREAENLRAKNRELMVQRVEETRHQSQLRYLAEHDTLTQLYNKPAFLRHAEGLVRQNAARPYCMVSLDVQRFRVFNSIFGHEEGDRLLRYIAEQLAEVVEGEGVYSRTESDRFAFLMPYDKEDLEDRMERLNASMRRYNRSFEVLLSFGVCLTEEASSVSTAEMYDRAEMAKYTIKFSYIKRWAYYDAAMRDRMIGEQEIISRMNAALEDGEFEVYFQPKCRLDTGAMAAAEALVRWNHPTRGLMSPDLFIPIFEKNGFIMKLDLYMWEHVCAFLQERIRQGTGLSISVNISRASLYNPTLCQTLDALCRKYQVPNECVEVEITETAYIENSHLLRSMIDEFHQMGFIVEMDDFGSGYSSLNLLKELQVDVLKLDMQLLSSLDGRSGSILRSIVDMAGRLSLPVIAEGVETEEQARFLAGIGCQQAQGYYYARPMPGDRFTQLLSERPDKSRLTPHTMDEAVRRMDGLLCGALLCSLEDRGFRLLQTNDYYTGMLCASGSAPTPHELESWIGAEDRRLLSRAMEKARNESGPQECAYIQRDQDGRYRLLHAGISYLFDEGEHPVYMMTVEDVSRRAD